MFFCHALPLDLGARPSCWFVHGLDLLFWEKSHLDQSHQIGTIDLLSLAPFTNNAVDGFKDGQKCAFPALPPKASTIMNI